MPNTMCVGWQRSMPGVGICNINNEYRCDDLFARDLLGVSKSSSECQHVRNLDIELHRRIVSLQGKCVSSGCRKRQISGSGIDQQSN